MSSKSGSVTQEDLMGCGVACVAFVLGVSYKEAQERYFKESRQYAGYHCYDLTRALAAAGLDYSYRRIGGRTRFKGGTIIFISRSEQYPAGHYLVKTEQGWMDSWINYPNIKEPRSGFRKGLPGRPKWVISQK